MRKRKITTRRVWAAMSALTLLCLSLGSCASDETHAVDSNSNEKKAFEFYLHTVASDADGMTRGTPSEDLEESAGIYAYTYTEDDAWDNGFGTAPDFMVNEEMQFAGMKWLTVNTFDKMPADSHVRYYAYYPYGLDEDVLSVTDDSYDNAPILTYTVSKDVEEQIDLMAGGCIDELTGKTKVYSTNVQNSKDPENVTITMNHLLTAVKFQVGECKESGRIKKITISNILRHNRYYLERNADDDDYVGWPVVNYGEDHDDWFENFSIDLNAAIKLTQRDANNNVVPQTVTDNAQWLMMLPQHLSEETTLEVVYNSGGSDHILTVEPSDLDGYWVQGTRIVYTLNIKSLQRMTVKSSVTPWGTGLNFVDGQPTNATTLDMGTNLTEWNTIEKNIASDDPR